MDGDGVTAPAMERGRRASEQARVHITTSTQSERGAKLSGPPFRSLARSLSASPLHNPRRLSPVRPSVRPSVRWRESKVRPPPSPKPLLMTIRRYFKITVITQGARRRGVKMPFQPSPSAAGGALGSNNKIGSFKNEATRYAAKEYSFQRGRTTLFLVQIKEISC